MGNPFLILTISFFALYFFLFIISFFKRKGFDKRAVLCGGGSSGHIYPAIAIGKALQPEIEKFLYIGAKGRIEETVVPKEKIPLKLICAYPYPSRSIFLIIFLLRLCFGILQSSLILFFFQPKYIIGTGGFVSAPVIFSAFILNKIGLLNSKIFLHEQNVTPGKLNYIASKIVDKIMITFPQSSSYFEMKAILTGYPVRKFCRKSNKEELLEKLKIPKGRKIVLAFGGSQGSKTINRCIVSALKWLLPYKDRLFVILSCGIGQKEYFGYKDVEEQLKENFDENEIKNIRDFFLYEPYFYNIDELFTVSDLVIARSGAGTLFELCSFELPSILIPKLGLSNEHQVMNAMAMEASKGAVILFEKPSPNFSFFYVDGKVLAEKIVQIVFSEETLLQMKEGTRKFSTFKNTEELIRRIILKNETSQNSDLSLSPFFRLKQPTKLLSFILKEKEKENFMIENIFKESEINFYQSLTLRFLYAQDWKERNIGVKLSAFFKTEEAKEALINIITNKTKGPLLQRLLGEPFKNVGFLRRNSFLTLRECNLQLNELKSILKIGFNDPYYEVKTASLLLAQKNNSLLLNDEEIIYSAKELLNEKEFEVVKEAVLLLGEIGKEGEIEIILSLKNHFFWQVRESALIAIRRSLERGLKIDKEKIKNEILKFNLTSTDFKPLFTLKQNYRKILELLENR